MSQNVTLPATISAAQSLAGTRGQGRDLPVQSIAPVRRVVAAGLDDSRRHGSRRRLGVSSFFGSDGRMDKGFVLGWKLIGLRFLRDVN
jgi:hypothetical protein